MEGAAPFAGELLAPRERVDVDADRAAHADEEVTGHADAVDGDPGAPANLDPDAGEEDRHPLPPREDLVKAAVPRGRVVVAVAPEGEVVDEKAAQEAREREGPARGKERQAPGGDGCPRRHLRLVLQPVGGRGPFDRREGGEEVGTGDGLEEEMDVLLVLRSPEVAEYGLGRASEHGPIVALPASEGVRRRGRGGSGRRSRRGSAAGPCAPRPRRR